MDVQQDVDRAHSQIPAGPKARIVEAVRQGNWPLAFIGAAGTGKTCAALCLLDHQPYGVVYRTVSDMCDECREVLVADGLETHWLWWAGWRNVALPCLDEIGARDRVSDHHYECVYRAVALREHRPAIFVSNLSIQRISELYDDRIASRVASGTVIDFGEDDLRVKGGEA